MSSVTSSVTSSESIAEVQPSEQILWAKHALTDSGWQSQVRIDISAAGKIAAVQAGHEPCGLQTGIVLPAVANLHSHAFQRAMAGMTETRGPDPRDSFWSWRKLMYRFLEKLTPDDAESIALFGQMEMLESGYTAVGEFHYLHHQSGGGRYEQRAEMAERMIAAATQSGIGLTLLPVLYERGGCDGRELSGGQLRFGNSIDEFAALYADIESAIVPHSQTMSLGIAPHSLRAVSPESLSAALTLVNGKPFHIHIAEQTAEVDEIVNAWGSRPVQWLLDNQPVDKSWCLVHATQMETTETVQLAKSGATVGLCPITESNLGDGIFDGVTYHQHSGSWGVGTDSNVRISLGEELRTLEYSQRLKEHGRAIYADQQRSTGRVLYDMALDGGARSLQRDCGTLAVGKSADLLSLEAESEVFIAVEKDNWLDAWMFASDDSLITDVWSSGRHVVSEGRHVEREKIEQRYRKTMTALMDRL